MSKILDSIVTINGEEYVLFFTESDYQYTDLEVALKVCLKSDFDKMKKKYPDFVEDYIYLVEPFCESCEDLKEIIEEYYEED